MENTLKYLINRELKFQRHGHDAFFQKRFDYASNLYSKDLKSHYGCVNSVEWSNSGEYMVSGKIFNMEALISLKLSLLFPLYSRG